MSSVPAEVLDIVRQLRHLSETGRLEWQESRPNRISSEVTVSLASGQWRLTWTSLLQTLNVRVWDSDGTSIFNFTIGNTDPHFAEFKAVYDAAVQHRRERITAKALNAMREELAAR